MHRPIALLITALLLISSPLAFAADWTLFRGTDRNGVSPEIKAPLNWSADKNVKWKAELPQPGNSSPIVAAGKVFVTCADDHSGSQRSLYCFDRADGKPLWKRTVPYDKPDKTHAQNPYCGASPATDGRLVVAWHGSAGLHAYDLEGKPLWSRDLGVIRHIWGWAGSPVIHGDVVYLNCGPGERTFVVAVDKRTGDVLWQTDEPGGAEDKSPRTGDWLGSWSTPIVAKVNGQEQLLVNFPGHVNAYDLKSGKILWTVDGNGDLAYTDVMIDREQNIAIAMGGYGGAAIGFKLTGGSGNITQSARLWRSPGKNPQRIGSGVILGKHLYLPSEPYLACHEVATGKEIWKHPIPRQQFWGSIVAVDERLYVTSQAGVTYVFAADPKEFRLLASNDLGEASNSTPAVSDGQLFLRTAGHVWCIEEK
jgi:outer membrane protein assembly factor BamB